MKKAVMSWCLAVLLVGCGAGVQDGEPAPPPASAEGAPVPQAPEGGNSTLKDKRDVNASELYDCGCGHFCDNFNDRCAEACKYICLDQTT